MSELTLLQPEKIKELVAATPTKKRAVLGKALRVASLALKDGRKDYCKAFELATAMVENYWSLGNELRRLSEAGTLHSGTLGNKKYQVKLSELGVNKLLSSRTQKLAELSKAELHEGIEKAFDEQTCKLPTLGGAISSAVHVGQNTGQPEWYTPDRILDAARETLGGIDLDPASSAIAQKRVKAKKYYSANQNGLDKGWSGRVWLNPPYSAGVVEQFTEKLCGHYEAGEVESAILLVNNSTETKWFQAAFIESTAFCFPAGRVQFLDDQGNPGAPLQGQALLYYGESPDVFADAFRGVGTVGRQTGI